jgi:hypothetical protein
MARNLEVRILGDADPLKRSLAGASRNVRDFEGHVGKAGRGALSASGAFRSLGRSVAFASSSFLGGAGLVFALKQSVGAASDLHEQLNKTDVVFGSSARTVKSWSATTARSLGIAQHESLGFAATFGNLLHPMGIARDRAAKMSIQFVKLAADMASFNNASPEDVLRALQSGLAGQVRPLRQYGIFLDQARIKAEALRLGLLQGKVSQQAAGIAVEQLSVAQAKYNKALKDYGPNSTQAVSAHVALEKAQAAVNKAAAGTTGTLTQQQKVLATTSIIMRDSKDAQGDFARTSGGLANQQRILSAEIKDTEAAIGTALMPTVLRLTKELTNWLGQSKNQERIQRDVNRAVQTAGDIISAATPFVKNIAGSFQAFAKAVGGTKHAFEILFALGVVGKLRAISVALGLAGASGGGAGIAGAAGKATTAVVNLRKTLATLYAASVIGGIGSTTGALGGVLAKMRLIKGLGAITILVTAAITAKWIMDKEGGIRGFLQAHIPGLKALDDWANNNLPQLGIGSGTSTNAANSGAGSLGASAGKRSPRGARGAGALGSAVGQIAHGRVRGVTGPVTPGLRAVELATGAHVNDDFATHGHAKNSYHYRGEAADLAVDRGVWAKLYANRGMFAELFGPWGLYHYGTKFYDSKLQSQHMDHIHVAYTGGPQAISKMLSGSHTTTTTDTTTTPTDLTVGTTPRKPHTPPWKGATEATIISAKASVTAMLTAANTVIGGMAGPMDAIERAAEAHLKTLREHLHPHMTPADLARTKAEIAKWGKVLNNEIGEQTKRAKRAFDSAAKQMLRSFDKETEAGLKARAAPDETPTEKLLRELQESHDDADRQRALAEAYASGDAQAIADAQYDIQVAALQKTAAAERKAADEAAATAQEDYQNMRDDQRDHLQDQLDDWNEWLTKKMKSWNQFWAWVKAHPNGGGVVPNLGETDSAPGFQFDPTTNFGGDVTEPTVNRTPASLTNNLARTSNGSPTVVVTVNGALLGSTVPEVANTIRRELLKVQNRNGTTGLV